MSELRTRAWMALGVGLSVAAGCGEPQIERAASAVWCREDVPATQAFDAREVLGLPEGRAAELTRKAGCAMVVIRRDDEQFATTANYDPKRLKVEVDDGLVTRLAGVD